MSIATVGNETVLIAKKATQSTPIVFAYQDPVSLGLVTSLAYADRRHPGTGRWTVDMGLSRSFQLGSQQMQFRWEIFNVFNTMTPNNPVSALNSSDFGRVTVPRAQEQLRASCSWR